jgi:hypothetical protein
LKRFAVEVPSEDHAAALELLSFVTSWHQPPGRYYLTAEATDVPHALLFGCSRAFFIKIPPGKAVYRHQDPAGVYERVDTDHIVVKTNDRALIFWEDDEGEHSMHLGLGKRYRIVDRGVMHWAENNGDTDRIHLLIEYPKV